MDMKLVAPSKSPDWHPFDDLDAVAAGNTLIFISVIDERDRLRIENRVLRDQIALQNQDRSAITSPLEEIRHE